MAAMIMTPKDSEFLIETEQLQRQSSLVLTHKIPVPKEFKSPQEAQQIFRWH